jgi:hypothetical protein
MQNIVDSLNNFNDISNSKKYSNYETSMGFVTSIDVHLKNLFKPNFTSLNFIESLYVIKKALEGEPTKDMFYRIKAYEIDYLDASNLNTNYLVDQVDFIMQDIFSFAKKHNIDVFDSEKEYKIHIDNLRDNVNNAISQVRDLKKLALQCSQYAKISELGEIYSSRHLKSIKKTLENSDLDNLDFPDIRGYFTSTYYLGKIADIMKVKNNVINKLMDADIVPEAEVFVRNQKNPTQLQQVIIEKSIADKIEFTSSQTISGAILFNDGSCCFREKNGDYQYNISHFKNKNMIEELKQSVIEFVLRKKPIIMKAFKQKFEEDNDDFHKILNTINRFLENENLVKTLLKDKYELFLKECLTKSVEGFDDSFSRKADEQRFIQFAYSIVSNKYKHLYNDKTMDLLKDIYEQKVSKENLQKFVGKKIAAFETASDLNKHLTSFLSKLDGFDMETLTNKANEVGATIVSSDNDRLIVETTDYEQMKELGTTSWCIVRDESYYEDYTGYGKRQYIVFDFTRTTRDTDSMIGITLEANGTFRNAHLKDDDSLERSEVMDLTDAILINQRHTFEKMHPELEKRLFKSDNEKTKITNKLVG